MSYDLSDLESGVGADEDCMHVPAACSHDSTAARSGVSPSLIRGAVVTLGALLAGCNGADAADEPPIVVNEVLVNHKGNDTGEFVELFGPAGASLRGLSLIVTEDDAGDSQGRIERRIDFTADQRLGANGFLLLGNPLGLREHYGVEPDLAFGRDFLENSSLSIGLVRTTSIAGKSVTEGLEVVDAVSLTDGGEGDESSLGAPTLGPDEGRLPAGVARRSDGVDTDTAADFRLAAFEHGPTNTPTPGGVPVPSMPERAGAGDERATPIAAIQGAGERSPLTGRVVHTSGVVTRLGNDGRGFFLQDPKGDGDPATSEGLFVGIGRESRTPAVRPGQRVAVTGRVAESAREGELPLTRLVEVEAVVVLDGIDELTPVRWTELPDQDLDASIAFFERHEGMLVAIPDAMVVGPTSRWGDFEVLAIGNQGPGSGVRDRPGGLFLRSLGDGEVDYNPERIAVAASDAPAVFPGDTVDVVGVLDYAFGRYIVRAVELEHTRAPRRAEEAVARPEGLRFASFNVENLFDLERHATKDDERSTPTATELRRKLGKLETALVDVLGTPALLAIQEVENTEILQQLADRVNRRAGTKYKAASIECSDGRGIEPAFLWDERHVTLIRAYQLAGDDVRAAYGPSSPSPGREPLVGEFKIGDESWTVVSCHLKSKGGDDALYGARRPPQRTTEAQRKAQARCVRRLVDQLLAADPDARVIVAGDMNDFDFAEPGEGADHPLGILTGSGDTALTNLVLRVPEADRFTYIWRGNRQILDHVLVSPALVERALDVRIHHVNAEYPHWHETVEGTAIRSSDHEPVEVTFR